MPITFAGRFALSQRWAGPLALDTASVLTGDKALGEAADRVLAVGALAALPAALGPPRNWMRASPLCDPAAVGWH